MVCNINEKKPVKSKRKNDSLKKEAKYSVTQVSDLDFKPFEHTL